VPREEEKVSGKRWLGRDERGSERERKKREREKKKE
jgi:hypothetical protein